MKKKILLVEDDLNLGESLKKVLEGESYDVVLLKSFSEAISFDANEVDLLILDWMLADGQGIDLLKEFRLKKIMAPIIMLTARTELIDRVLGLEAGANDYVVKPFEPRELLARIRVQLRSKVIPFLEGQKVEIGELLIETDKREVLFKNKKIDLTKMEFDLLKLLAENPDRAFSREELLNKVWGYENYPSTRTVDTHVLQLRQKIDEDMIETIRGIGYRFRLKTSLR